MLLWLLELIIRCCYEEILEGTSISMHNNLSALDDNYIMHKALELRVDISTMSFKTVHLLKDWEKSRHDLAAQKLKMSNSDFIESEIMIPSDCDDNNENNGNEEDFTHVLSRKSKNKLKKILIEKVKSRGVPLWHINP